MDNLYLDANVILDYLQQRGGSELVEKILLLSHQSNVNLYSSVLNFATIFYIERRRGHTNKQILERFRLINKVIDVVGQSTTSYYSAVGSGFSDFEDALQYFAAVETGVDFFITNNKKDYRKSAIPVLTAREYLKKRPSI